MLFNYCTTASENDEELREYSLQVLYMFISNFLQIAIRITFILERFIIFVLVIKLRYFIKNHSIYVQESLGPIGTSVQK